MNRPLRHLQLIRVLSTALCCLLLTYQVIAAQADYAQHIASLIDRAKLDTLGNRSCGKESLILSRPDRPRRMGGREFDPRPRRVASRL